MTVTVPTPTLNVQPQHRPMMMEIITIADDDRTITRTPSLQCSAKPPQRQHAQQVSSFFSFLCYTPAFINYAHHPSQRRDDLSTTVP